MIKNNNNVSPILIRRLELIFSAHNWSLEFDHEQELFNRFCQMLNCFSPDQQDCVLELSKNFLRIDTTHYYYHIRQCLKKIDIMLVKPIHKIFILPLKKKEDYERGIKSGGVMAYFFNDPTLLMGSVLQNKEINVVEKPNSIPKNINAQPNMVILVDDFIGSGETTISCLNYLMEFEIAISKLMIITLVIQNKGQERLAQTGIPFYFSESRVRGISDFYQEPLKEKLTNLMSSIEDMLDVRPNMRFGYNQTEALVKMIRTPNDTFPAFWDEPKLANGSMYIAPFPRY